MSGGLVPPHRSARRPELLEQLIVSLTSADDKTLPIKTRFLDDPTIALLDAWATVADVLGFYVDRIADEGYLSTATQPGSILALAALVGHRPRPGLGARAHVAYTMNLDPDDNAVQLDSGLLCQSVPGAGEQPQTFETVDRLVARPSWSLLKPKQDQPLKLASTEAAQQLNELAIAGTVANLAPNDVILLDLGAVMEPVPIRVASATVDHVANVTHVSLQTKPAAAATSPAGSPTGVTAAIDALLGPLAKPPPPLPESVNHLPRTAESVFSAESDAIPRLLSTLQPVIAPTLYPALDTTGLGDATVLGASALRVKASPFGAQSAPKQLFDRGQAASTEDWPIGDTHTLTLSMNERAFTVALRRAADALNRAGDATGDDLAAFLENFSAPVVARSAAPAQEEISLECALARPDGDIELSGSGVIDVTGSPPWSKADLQPLGDVDLTVDGTKLDITYRGNAKARVSGLRVSAELDAAAKAVAVTLDGTHVLTWHPTRHTSVRVQTADKRLSIERLTEVDAEATLVFSIETLLPPGDLTVVHLDGIYDGIVPYTPVMIERMLGDTSAPVRDSPAALATPSAAPPMASIANPLIATVQSVQTVAATGFGTSSKVTRLQLDKPWLTESDIDQSTLRAITIRAQPEPLQPLPVSVLADVSRDSIELDGLIAGMEAGRLIIVRGVRADLPAGATVTGGELAMVASITAAGVDGDTTHTTLHLATPLAYAYRRRTVEIFGNVVAARQGATIHEILGSGQPANPHQMFTLTSGPLLADPAPTAGGFQSTLTVTADDIGYQEVDRFDHTTSPRSFLTGTDVRGATTITFAAPLPAGTENVRAAYRAGDGSQGNVRADQLTQLLSRPSGVASVTNPLTGVGGTAGDGPEALRKATPLGLRGLGRIVTVEDCADFASSWAGVGKARATPVAAPDGVLVTIAGLDPVALHPDGGLCSSIRAAIALEADPAVPVVVAPAELFVIVLEASVVRDPLVDWDTAAATIRAALLAKFGYPSRELAQDVALSDLISAAHAARSVRSFTVTALALVPATVSASALASRLPALLAPPAPDVLKLSTAVTEWGIPSSPGQPMGAGVAYLSDAVPDTLILREQTT